MVCILDQLWTQDILHQIVFTNTKEDVLLAKNMEAEVLQSVLVVLVAVNTNEILATHCYLEPLDDRGCIYQFKTVYQDTKQVIYYIGKYGSCPVAIRDTGSAIDMHDTSSIEPMITDQYFPNLSAIISVGVISGVKTKVKLCDVLVSSEVINCEKSTDNIGYLPKGEVITVSSQLIKLLTRVQWPNDVIKKQLKDNGIPLPNITPGIILSLPQAVDDLSIKKLVTSIVPKAIGVEMEGAHLFTGVQQTIVDTIIVKSVCDFVDGKDSNKYQPTAALLAADLVHKCLSSPQGHEKFNGM